MSHQGKELVRGGFLCNFKSLNFPLLLNITPTKVLSPSITYWKKGWKSLLAFRQILPKIYTCGVHFQWHSHDVFQKSSLDLNPLMQNSVQYGFLPELYLMYPPFYQKGSLLWCCFVAPTMCGLYPLPLNLYEKPLGWREKNPTQQPKIYSFPPPEKSSSINVHILLLKVSFLPRQITIFM